MNQIIKKVYGLSRYAYRFAILALPAGAILCFGAVALTLASEQPTDFNIQNGIVDSSFVPSIGFAGRIMAAVQQPDGKLVVVGRFSSVNSIQQVNIARLHPNGTVDHTFLPPLITDGMFVLAIQSDGKILVSHRHIVSSVSRDKVVRLNTDGSLDSTFVSGVGTNGPSIRSMFVLHDGDILVAGDFSGYQGIERRSLVRLNPDGSIDQSFTAQTGQMGDSGDTITSLVESADGSIFVGGRFTRIGGVLRNGIAKLDFNGTVAPSFNSNIDQTVTEVIPTSDGKSYIGGRFGTPTGLRHAGRLNADGILDTTFNADPRIDTYVDGIGLHPDGRLFVYGNFSSQQTPNISRKIYLLNTNGTVDESFIAASRKGLITVAEAIVRPDGKILLAGDFQNIDGNVRCSLALFNQDFSVDGSFNPYLVSKTLLGPELITSVVAQPDGKVLIGGTFRQIDGVPIDSIARLNVNGTVDSSFNAGNVLFNGDALPKSVESIALQTDGKILIGGNFTSAGGVSRNAVARLHPNGNLDPSFNIGGGDLLFTTLALQPDGKVIIGGGFTFVNGTPRKNIARLDQNGVVDTTFDAGNLTTSGSPTKIIIQADNKILVSGVRNTAVPDYRGIARLNTDGTRDASFNVVVSTTTPYIELQADQKIFAAGSISSVNGQALAGLARINPNGTLDTTFTGQITTSGVITATIQQNGMYLVGGSFSSVQSTFRQGFARLHESGSLDLEMFEGHVQDGQIRRLWSLPGGRILIFGTYNSVDNSPRFGLIQMRTEPRRSPMDFDGDGKTDLSIFRPNGATGSEWWWLRSSNGTNGVVQFGVAADKLAPVDFTGDGKTDVAFWRPASGQWFVLRSEDFSFYAFPFGATGDVPVPTDYDGDGKADAAVFRESSLTWFISKSSGGTDIVGFGAAGDRPVVADYDGDGKSDIAIFRPSGTNGAEWWIRRSSNLGVFATQFGQPTDKAVAGDYTGDGKADIAFWTPSSGNWYVLRSEDFSYYAFPFGAATDVPVPGDYDGDGKLDAGVFRPSTSTWYAQRSAAGTLIQQFGIAGDLPVPNAFVR